MRECPIIFNAEMVRAVMEGRKTQTRRIIKVQPHAGVRNSVLVKSGFEDGHGKELVCPFGAVGDRLWVRETWQGPLFDEEQLDEFLRDTEPFYTPKYCQYAADGGPKPEYCDRDDNIRYGWRPSIHMPRWASRITLEITGVRVERLQDISQADAIAEGAPPSHPSIDAVSRDYGFPDFSRSWFGQTWWSIYGAESWQANPWVWVIEFKRVEGE